MNNRVKTAVTGSTLISDPLLANCPAAYYDLGWVTDGGVQQSNNYQETKKYGWQGGSVIRVIRSQFERNFSFAAAEENAVVLGLAYPGVTPVTTGTTAEVQTVTIAGSPTGGTFTLNGFFGSRTVAYNVPTATLATNLTGDAGGTVTVTGTAGTSYVITFPSSLGNVNQMTVGSALTGGSSPTASVATTTPGVNGITTRAVGSSTSQNLRQWGVYVSDGNYQKCFYAPSAEAVLTGNIALTGTDDQVYTFDLVAYPDSIGAFYYEISNNPAVGSGLFT